MRFKQMENLNKSLNGESAKFAIRFPVDAINEMEKRENTLDSM